MSHTPAPPTKLRQRKARALGIAVALNVAFVVAELAAGLLAGSLALVSDAAHNASDVLALSVGLAAYLLSASPPTRRLTYGFQRAEVLAAQFNALLLIGAAALVARTALSRLAEPPSLSGGVVAATAAVGVLVNGVSVLVVAKGRASDLNSRAVLLSLGADVSLSAATALSGLAMVGWGAYWLDPALSLLIAGVMCIGSARILWEVSHVLLEGAPRHIDVQEVRAFLCSQPGVEAVHHLHVWNLSSENLALSGHVVLRKEMSLHDAQEERERLSAKLQERFGIGHSTLELECHPCEDDSVVAI